jgi:hypothetical protein
MCVLVFNPYFSFPCFDGTLVYYTTANSRIVMSTQTGLSHKFDSNLFLIVSAQWHFKCYVAAEWWECQGLRQVIWLKYRFGFPLKMDLGWGCYAGVSNRFWTIFRGNFWLCVLLPQDYSLLYIRSLLSKLVVLPSNAWLSLAVLHFACSL